MLISYAIAYFTFLFLNFTERASGLVVDTGFSITKYQLHIVYYSSNCLIVFSSRDTKSLTNFYPNDEEPTPLVHQNFDFFNQTFVTWSWSKNFNFHHAERHCQLYILLEPNYMELYHIMLNGPAGFYDTSTVIALMPPESEPEENWFHVLDQEKYRTILKADKYSSLLYFVIGSNSEVSSSMTQQTMYWYCYNCDGYRLIKLIIPYPDVTFTQNLETVNKNGMISFNGAEVDIMGYCHPEDRNNVDNLCGYTKQMQKLMESHFNFSAIMIQYTNKTEVKSYYPATIHQTLYSENRREEEVDSLSSIVIYRDCHAFYCLRSVQLKGSYWTKWTAPFDSPTWTSAIIVCLVCVLVLRHNGKGSSAIFQLVQILARQDVPKMTKFQVIISLGFFNLTTMYEGLITSQIVSPLPIKSFETLSQLLDDGFRFFFPVQNISEFYTRYKFPEFTHGFSIRNQSYRYYSSFVAGEGKWWDDIMRENVSIKLAVDIPGDETVQHAYKLQPRYCNILPEVYFVRIYSWKFVNRNRREFLRFITLVRDAGLYQFFSRRYDLEMVGMKVKGEVKHETLEKSFIKLTSGIFTIFGIAGVLMAAGMMVFVVEFVGYFLINRSNLVQSINQV